MTGLPVRGSWAALSPRTLRGRATLAFAAITLVLCSVPWPRLGRRLAVPARPAGTDDPGPGPANAAQVQRGCAAEGLVVPQLLAQLPRQTGSTSLYVDDGEWTTTSLLVGRTTSRQPAAPVARGTPSRQRIATAGRHRDRHRDPAGRPGDAYFEVFPLDELDRTYRVLARCCGSRSWSRPTLAGRGLVEHRVHPAPAGTRHRLAAQAFADGDLGGPPRPTGRPLPGPLAASFNRTADRRWRSGCAATHASPPTSATSCAPH